MNHSLVSCTVNSPVALQIGEPKTDTSRPGVYVIDITFPQGQLIKIQEISFKNYYTAFVTVRLQWRVSSSQSQWVTCLRDHRLMPNPHTEEGSQDYFRISRWQMLIEPDDVTAVRLVLRQPSSAWLNFTLEDIRIHPCASDDEESNSPTWISQLTPVDEVQDLKGLPDPQLVASSIQQMWALTEIMQTSQTAAPIGRFDGIAMSRVCRTSDLTALNRKLTRSTRSRNSSGRNVIYRGDLGAIIGVFTYCDIHSHVRRKCTEYRQQPVTLQSYDTYK